MWFIQGLHILACVALIVIVLLQADKGEGLSGAFGGGASSAIFGKRSANTFMAKVTALAAVVFMVTTLFLTLRTAKEARAHPAPLSQHQPGSPTGPNDFPAQ